MSQSFKHDASDPLARKPGENLVAWSNRKLRAKGRFDIEWYQTPGGGLRLRDVVRTQQDLDL
jgi:hypothetical protein